MRPWDKGSNSKSRRSSNWIHRFWRELIPIFYWLMSSSFISRDAKNRHHNGRNLFNLHKLMNHSEPIVWLRLVDIAFLMLMRRGWVCFLVWNNCRYIRRGILTWLNQLCVFNSIKYALIYPCWWFWRQTHITRGSLVGSMGEELEIYQCYLLLFNMPLSYMGFFEIFGGFFWGGRGGGNTTFLHFLDFM